MTGLLKREAIDGVVATRVESVRAALAGLPSRLAPLLANVREAYEIDPIVKQFCRQEFPVAPFRAQPAESRQPANDRK